MFAGDDFRCPALISGKGFIRFFLICLGFLIVLEPKLLSSERNLLGVYNSGPIRLEQDTEFGKHTDWKNLFYHLFCDMTVAPDGSIFVASSRQHKIFRFDEKGKLIKSFGQRERAQATLTVRETSPFWMRSIWWWGNMPSSAG